MNVDPDHASRSAKVICTSIWENYGILCLFVCVEVLRPSQPNGVMSSAVSLPNHIFGHLNSLPYLF